MTPEPTSLFHPADAPREPRHWLPKPTGDDAHPDKFGVILAIHLDRQQVHEVDFGKVIQRVAPGDICVRLHYLHTSSHLSQDYKSPLTIPEKWTPPQPNEQIM